jgi:hypothetical protein
MKPETSTVERTSNLAIMYVVKFTQSKTRSERNDSK